jgi:hypothetical protein
MSWRARCEELARQLDCIPDDVIERWEERAAIREHDGGQPRADAELAAFDDVRTEMELALVAGPRRGPRAAGDPSHTKLRDRDELA